MEIRKWHDDYTIDELEIIINNLLIYTSDKIDDDYNWGTRTMDEVKEFWSDIGFHQDEIDTWYDWADEEEV